MNIFFLIFITIFIIFSWINFSINKKLIDLTKEKFIFNTNNIWIDLVDMFQNNNISVCKRRVKKIKWWIININFYTWSCYKMNTSKEVFLFNKDVEIDTWAFYIIYRWNNKWSTIYKNEIIRNWIIYINRWNIIWKFKYDLSWKNFISY